MENEDMYSWLKKARTKRLYFISLTLFSFYSMLIIFLLSSYKMMKLVLPDFLHFKLGLPASIMFSVCVSFFFLKKMKFLYEVYTYLQEEEFFTRFYK